MRYALFWDLTQRRSQKVGTELALYARKVQEVLISSLHFCESP
jgi:hypothetical protein